MKKCLGTTYFSCISCKALDACKFHVSENCYHNCTNRINWYMRKNLALQICLLGLNAQKFTYMKNTVFTHFYHNSNRIVELVTLFTLSFSLSSDLLSLYSTATQNTWRPGLALGNAPDARILRWRYQHFGIFWRYLTLKCAFSPTPTPDASQWNIGCVGSQLKILALACTFHVFCVDFICVWYPMRTPFPVEYGF